MTKPRKPKPNPEAQPAEELGSAPAGFGAVVDPNLVQVLPGDDQTWDDVPQEHRPEKEK